MSVTDPLHSPLFDFKAKHGRIVTSEFKAPKWALNRHVQTIWPRFIQVRQKLSYGWQKLTMPDGDFVDVAWSPKPFAIKGIAVIFHGLEGSIRSHYAHDMMATLARHGWLVGLMHFRGCGQGPNNTPRAYHSGETSDAGYFLNWLQEHNPNIPKVGIGFSLGANMLLKYLGENPKQKILDAAVAVSAPLKLDECSKSVSEGFSKVYQKYLLKSMNNTLRLKMQKLDYSNLLDFTSKDINSIRTFRDFDERVTAPIHGFKGAGDYYEKCSGLPFLKKIKTPTLILHAKDDPFMNENVIPQESDLSSHVRMELSENGGHVGFMQGSPFKPSVWLHKRVPEFFAPYFPIKLHLP